MNTSTASEMVWNGIMVSTSLAASTVNQGMEFVTAELVFACSPIMQTEQEVYKETSKKSRTSVGKESKLKAKPQTQQEVYKAKSKKSTSSVGKEPKLSDLIVKRNNPWNEKVEKAPQSFSTDLLDSLLTDETLVFPSKHHDHRDLESLKSTTPSRAQDIFRPRPYPLPLDDSERFGYLIPTADEPDPVEPQRVVNYPERDPFPDRNRSNPQPALFDDEATMDTRTSSKSKATSTVISKIKSTVEPHVVMLEQRMDGPEPRQGHPLDSERHEKMTQDARTDSNYYSTIIKTAVEPIGDKNQRMDGQEARQGDELLTGKRQKKDISSEIKELQRVVEMVERQRTLDRSSDSEKSRRFQTNSQDSRKMQELKVLMSRLERLSSRHKESKQQQQHSVHPVPQVLLRSSDMQDQIKPTTRRRLAHHSDTEQPISRLELQHVPSSSEGRSDTSEQANAMPIQRLAKQAQGHQAEQQSIVREHIMEETTIRLLREKVIENSRPARPITTTTNAYYLEQPKPEIIDLLGYEDTSSLVSSRVRSSYALATQ
jgi:hypothetical protein